VIGPAGVVVSETKYLAGQITCEQDGMWIQSKRGEVRLLADPAAQVQRAAGGVMGRLDSHGLAHVPVRSVLVMAHPSAALDVSRSPVTVLRPAELVPLLRQLAARRARLDQATGIAVSSALLDSCRRHVGSRYETASHARAQALVEFACALPVVLMLVFGLLGVARVSTTLLGLTAVAREAARAGARDTDPCSDGGSNRTPDTSAGGGTDSGADNRPDCRAATDHGRHERGCGADRLAP
jgi:hypothetical protein